MFNFFIIDPTREQYYTSKWQELVPTAPIKKDKLVIVLFHPFLPLNINYLIWVIIIDTSILKIINSDLGFFKIIIDKFSNINNIEMIISKNNKIKFTDTLFNYNLFIREKDNIKYFIKDNKIVLTIKII